MVSFSGSADEAVSVDGEDNSSVSAGLGSNTWERPFLSPFPTFTLSQKLKRWVFNPSQKDPGVHARVAVSPPRADRSDTSG